MVFKMINYPAVHTLPFIELFFYYILSQVYTDYTLMYNVMILRMITLLFTLYQYIINVLNLIIKTLYL